MKQKTKLEPKTSISLRKSFVQKMKEKLSINESYEDHILLAYAHWESCPHGEKARGK